MMKEFYIPCDCMQVHAKLDFPAGKTEGEKMPLLVVFHGFTGHMEERHIIAVAEAAREEGFATLRVELYGHGKSDGDFSDHTILHWMTQGMRVIDYAAGLDWVSSIYLTGHSQGGLNAVLVAGIMQDKIRGLIPMSPAMVIRDGAREGKLLGFTFDPENPPECITNDSGVTLKGNYARVARILPVEECIATYHGPVCVIHGTKDLTVPYQYGVDLAEQYQAQGNDAELVTIEGADHCYDRDEELSLVCDAVRKFLRREEVS